MDGQAGFPSTLNRDRLEAALVEADIPVLLMVLVHLTGDERWINPPFQPERDGRLFAEESGGLPEEIQQEVRSAALKALTQSDPSGIWLDDDTIHRMMTVLVGERVPREYLPVALEDAGLRPAPEIEPPRRSNSLSVTIIGAGVSGVCAAIRLRALGIPFVVLEKNDSVGGTWYENTYPEAGVDTPNHFYSYSFATKWRWNWYFSKQQEILAYIEDCVDRFDVRDDIVLGANVDSARYDADRQRWHVRYTTSEGTVRERVSNVVITAVGMVNTPKSPTFEGLESFRGPVVHTARWPDDLDLYGKRVALIGTGASAVQAARSIAAEADTLTIYQRSPQWIMPNPDYHLKVSAAKQLLLEHVPFYASWYRFGLFWRHADGVYASLQVDPSWPHPERSVNATNDRHRGFLTRYMTRKLESRPDLLAKALPDYPPYGKRMVIDNDWFETLMRDNVELVDAPVAAATETAVRTPDGTEREADVVILATGFHATRMLWPLELVGRDGVSIHVGWNDDEPRSNLGMTTPNFPNLFMLLGPTTALGHGGSVLFHTEAQVRYIALLLTEMINSSTGVLECTEAAAEAYTERADVAHAAMVFSHPGMNNWHKNRKGKVVTVSPWRMVDYWQMTRVPELEDFTAEPIRNGVTPVATGSRRDGPGRPTG